MPVTASMTVDSQSSKFVSSVVYTSTVSTTGIITVTGGAAETKIAGKTIDFTGTVLGNGQVDWTCRKGSSTPMDDKYLPASCK